MDRIKISVCQKPHLSYNDFFYFLWSFMKNESLTYKPDFLIFPEYYLEDPVDGERPFTNPYIQAASTVAQKYECYIFLGSIRERFQEEWFNTTYIIGPGGDVVARYRKQRPWKSENVSSGNQTGIFDTKFGKVGILICFDGDIENNELMEELLRQKPRFVFIPIDMSIPNYLDSPEITIPIWQTAIKNVSKRFFPLACKYEVTFVRADFAYPNNSKNKTINYGASIIIKPYQVLPAPTWSDCCFSTFVEEKMYKSAITQYASDLDDDITQEEYYAFIDSINPSQNSPKYQHYFL